MFRKIGKSRKNYSFNEEEVLGKNNYGTKLWKFIQTYK